MEIKGCENCKYSRYKSYDFPCNECVHSMGTNENFRPKTLPQQQTIPPMPPVTPPKEEINHPDRYAGGKYECIDVMQDVFGAEAVKHFCMLNAFKYLRRAEKKNGVEDIKKAVWYLNKYIELVESEGMK